MQYRFDEGYKVGRTGKNPIPKGIDLTDEDFNRNLEKTKRV